MRESEGVDDFRCGGTIALKAVFAADRYFSSDNSSNVPFLDLAL